MVASGESPPGRVFGDWSQRHSRASSPRRWRQLPHLFNLPCRPGRAPIAWAVRCEQQPTHKRRRCHSLGLEHTTMCTAVPYGQSPGESQSAWSTSFRQEHLRTTLRRRWSAARHSPARRRGAGRSPHAVALQLSSHQCPGGSVSGALLT